MSGNFGYMGDIPWGDLDHMWRVGRYGGRNHVCNISWLSVNGCGWCERGKFAFSHWLDASPLQHWSHYRVTVWYVDEIWFADRHRQLKTVTSTNTKPEVVFSGRGRHLEKYIWRHISALGGPIWMTFGNIIQNINHADYDGKSKK